MENQTGQQPGKLIPGIIGGAIMAVLSSIPFVNCLCCLWVLGGGAIAVYMYKKELPPEKPLTSGDGAVTGLIAGVFGALFGTLIAAVMMAFNFQGDAKMMELFSQFGDQGISPEIEEMLAMFQGPMALVFSLLSGLIIYCPFGALGGVIGASIFKKKDAPAGQSTI